MVRKLLSSVSLVYKFQNGLNDNGRTVLSKKVFTDLKLPLDNDKIVSLSSSILNVLDTKYIDFYVVETSYIDNR